MGFTTQRQGWISNLDTFVRLKCAYVAQLCQVLTVEIDRLLRSVLYTFFDDAIVRLNEEIHFARKKNRQELKFAQLSWNCPRWLKSQA